MLSHLCPAVDLVLVQPHIPDPCLLHYQVFGSVLIRVPCCCLHSSPTCSKPFTDPRQPRSGCSARSSDREQASLPPAPTSLSSCAGFVGALSHPSLEKGMATHSTILAWRTPWTEEPGRLQSMASQRVRHDSATDTIIFTFFSPLSVCIFWSLCPQAREQCARAQKEGEKRALPFPLLLQWVPVPLVFPQPTEGCT